tara:strand:+ start:157 stop:1257 length:1101 start_codon:yes stop_codon:yes gene_type:complete
MKIKVNKAVANSKPYKLVTQKAWLEEEKSKVLKLDWNESTIAPSPKVIDSLKETIRADLINWYPNIQNSILINKIANYCNVSEDNIQYFNGSDSIHESIFKTFSNDSDIFTIIGPTYDHPRSIAECFGLSLDFFYLDKNFEFDLKSFKEYIKNINPTLVYICSPNNPVGNSYSNNILSEIFSEFPSILFIIDEAYQEFRSDKSCAELVKEFDNIIVTRTFSKAFGLASLRIGYCISSKSNIELMNKYRNPKSINLFAQVAAIAALDDINYTKKYINQVNESKKYFIDSINQNLSQFIKPMHSDGNFILFKINDSIQPNDLMNFFEQRKIYIRNYSHIEKLENHLRVTIGTKDQTEKIIATFKDYFL